LLLSVMAAAVRGRAAEHQPIALFDEQDAARLRFDEQEFGPALGRESTSRTRSIVKGPRVIIVTPEVTTDESGQRMIELTPPADLVVRFEETLAPVDMKSLKVRARKGFFSKSLTDLMARFINGTVLEALGLNIPIGRFIIELTIADENGRETREVLGLYVGGGS